MPRNTILHTPLPYGGQLYAHLITIVYGGTIVIRYTFISTASALIVIT